MSRGGGKAPKSGRAIAPDEAELWDLVTSSVDKVKNKARVPSHAGDGDLPAVPVRAAPVPAKNDPRSTPKRAPPQPPPKPGRPPPMAEFDRRAVRQVSSGKVSIDARVDLHGLRQRDARTELHAFLRAAQARDCKMVLIITGKGDAADDRDHLSRAFGKAQRGILRRNVPQWLEEPDLRTIVLSYTSASVRHGGDGALYVQLRKAGR